MRILKIALIVFLLTTLITGGYFLYIRYINPQSSGIFIETNPISQVYINGEQVGRTPYKETMDPGEVTIKLVPESFEEPLSPHEIIVNLVSGVETVVRRDFANTSELSAGEIVSFEKIFQDESRIAIVTFPESAQVSIDNVEKAFSPYETHVGGTGDHTLEISATGFVSRTLKVKTHMGYKLTAFVTLAKDENYQNIPENEPTPEPETQKPETVRILSTPVGFLRVRAEASTSSEEVGQADPGDEYTLLETDEDTGWFKILFDEETGAEGWVSNQYAEIVDDEETTPTPTESS